MSHHKDFGFYSQRSAEPLEGLEQRMACSTRMSLAAVLRTDQNPSWILLKPLETPLLLLLNIIHINNSCGTSVVASGQDWALNNHFIWAQRDREVAEDRKLSLGSTHHPQGQPASCHHSDSVNTFWPWGPWASLLLTVTGRLCLGPAVLLLPMADNLGNSALIQDVPSLGHLNTSL